MADPQNPAATPGAVTDSGTATKGNGDASAATGYDHEAKLRAGGEWAVDYVKKLESRADKAEREARELTGKTAELKRYFEGGLSGKDIAGHLGTLERMLTDPVAGAAVKSYIATGKFEVPKGAARAQDDDEEYLSDEQREIRALKAELQDIRGIARESQLGIGQQAVTRNLEKIASEMGLGPDELAQVKSSASEIVRGWQSQGDSGERALRSLMHPENGLKTARTLVLESLGPEGLEKVYRTKFLRENQTRRGMATDSPSPLRVGGSKAMPEFNSVFEAIQALEARPELLDEHGY